MFDPYHKWLAIPKDQRPPTHYQLLGIAPGEQDADVIDEAALRQMAHVRAYQIGPHAAESQRVLNEISQARTVLLNVEKRKAYDEELAKKAGPLPSALPSVVPVRPGPPSLPSSTPPALPSAVAVGVAERPPVVAKRRSRLDMPPQTADAPSVAKQGVFLTTPMLLGIIGGGVALVAIVFFVLVGVVGISLFGSRPADVPIAQDGNDQDKKQPIVKDRPVDPPPLIVLPKDDKKINNKDNKDNKNNKDNKPNKDNAVGNPKQVVTMDVVFPPGGRYVSELPLADDDPREPQHQAWGVYRIYLVPMQAGKTYAFELGRGTPQHNPMLIIYDPTGKKKVYPGSIVNGVNKGSYKPTKAGTYRVHTVMPPEIAADFQLTITEEGAAPVEVAMPTEVGPKTYDLLSIIDLNVDVVDGKNKWKMQDKTLVCTEGHFVPRIQIPYTPPEEYDFTVTFSQPKMRNGISLIMPKPGPFGGMFYWCAGHSNGEMAGFGNSNGHNTDRKLSGTRKGLVQPDKEYTTTVQVRKGSVTALLNGEKLLSFKTNYSDLSIDNWRKMKNERLLGIGADDPALISRIEIVEVTGKGKPGR